jgi:hypothetical protein
MKPRYSGILDYDYIALWLRNSKNNFILQIMLQVRWPCTIRPCDYQAAKHLSPLTIRHLNNQPLNNPILN